MMTEVEGAVGQARIEAKETEFEYLQGACRHWIEKVSDASLPRNLPLPQLMWNGSLLERTAIVIATKRDKKAPKPPSKALKGEDVTKDRGYRAYESVERFLNEAKELGLKDIERFVPADVVDQKDLLRVYQCIRTVAMKSVQYGLPSFMSPSEELEMRKRMMSTNRTSGMAGDFADEKNWTTKTPEKWDESKMPSRNKKSWEPSPSKSWRRDASGQWITGEGARGDGGDREDEGKGLLGRVGGAVKGAAVFGAKAVATAAAGYGVWYVLYDRFGPRHYTVRSGDTLTGVVYGLLGRRAARQKTQREIDRIVANNPSIFDPDLIYPRQKIKVKRKVLGL